jgi:hypothetical protein
MVRQICGVTARSSIRMRAISSARDTGVLHRRGDGRSQTRIELWKPALHHVDGKSEPDGRSGTIRDQKSACQKLGQNGAGLTFLVAGDRAGAPSGELAHDDGFAEQRPGASVKGLGADFLLTPDFHSSQETIEIQQAFHEGDLVEADLEEEGAECLEAREGQIASPVEIPSAGFVGYHELGLVAIDLSRQPAGNRPELGSDAEFSEVRMRQKPGDTSIAVEERMNPEQPVMRSGDRRDPLDLRQATRCIGIDEPCQKGCDLVTAGRDVPADLNMDTPKLSRDDGQAFTGVGIIDP